MTGKLPTPEGIACVRKKQPLKDLGKLVIEPLVPTAVLSEPTGKAERWLCVAPPRLLPYNLLPEVVVLETTVRAVGAFYARRAAAVDLQCEPSQVKLSTDTSTPSPSETANSTRPSGSS